MKFAEAELRQITEDTWKILLGEELQLCARPVAPAQIENSIAACAQIAGDWQLAVVLYCSTALAHHVAGVMFEEEENSATAEDYHDALCELVNIIGGNIKGALSGSSHLSLPTLVKGQDFKIMFPRHVLLSEAAFECRGQPLIVVVLGEDKLGAGRENRPANGAVP